MFADEIKWNDAERPTPDERLLKSSEVDDGWLITTPASLWASTASSSMRSEMPDARYGGGIGSTLGSAIRRVRP
jgi:hypothetical protein